MTTLLISDIFPPKCGGSGRWFWEIYRRLPRSEYAIAAGLDPRQEEFDRTHDLRVHRLQLAMSAWGVRSFQGLCGYWRCTARLRKLIRQLGEVNMLHAGRCLPEGVMALVLSWRLGLPYSCYVHGEDVTTAGTSRELSWLVRQVLARAEFVVANSRNTARILKSDWGLPEDRLRLLYPGVDTQKFQPAPRDAQVRRQLGWGDRPVILTVGRLQKRKGHDMLIQALNEVRRAFPDVLYAMVGDGEERQALERLVAAQKLENHVQFLGECADRQLIHCYQQCDLFALPNRQVGQDIEGFGMVLVEAQACGRPVIAGASGGTAETMRIPETGQVVPCDEPGPLAALLLDLLGDAARREAMGRAARAWVVERFDWARLTEQAAATFRAGKPTAGGLAADPLRRDARIWGGEGALTR